MVGGIRYDEVSFGESRPVFERPQNKGHVTADVFLSAEASRIQAGKRESSRSFATNTTSWVPLRECYSSLERHVQSERCWAEAKSNGGRLRLCHLIATTLRGYNDHVKVLRGLERRKHPPEQVVCSRVHLCLCRPLGSRPGVGELFDSGASEI